MTAIYTLFLVALAYAVGAKVQHRDRRDSHSRMSFLNVVHSRAIHEGMDSGMMRRAGHKYDSCLVTKCPPNVVFLLDGSDSLPPSGYRLAQAAVAREIRAVTQAFVNTDVGVVLFSDDSEVLELRERSPEEVRELVSQVENLRQPRKKTSLPTALKRARDTLLEYSKSETRAYSGDRGGPVIVLLSDGHPDNEKQTLQEAFLARQEDILIVSLYLEPAHHRLLRDISQVVQEVKTAINWTALISCPEKVMDPVPLDSHCRDFMLVVDGSDSVLLHKETVRQFLAYTALRYRQVGNVVGVNLYGTDPALQPADTRIVPTENKPALADQIHQKLVFPTSGGTGTDRAIAQSLDMLRGGQRRKESALVIITDGPSLDVEATTEAIRQSRDSNHPIVIIRVGHAMTDQELNLITSGDQASVYTVDHFTQLFYLNFDSHLCGPAEIKCPSVCPRNQSPRNCQCVCDNTCPGGRLADPNNDCSCGCSNVCPPWQIGDPNNPCACVCPKSCPNGERPDTSDQCSCQICSRRCPAGQILNSESCSCFCPNRCPNGQLPSPQSNCNCQFCSNACPTGQTPSPGNDCTCSCQNSCPNGQTPDISNGCRCVCPNSCPSGQTPDIFNGCRCVCPNSCPNGQTPDISNGCRCVCPNSCPSGQTPDISNGCRCICPNSCPNGQPPDPQNNCRCGCGNICPQGKVPLPEENCRCQCPNVCPLGQVPNINNCECSCRVSCPEATPRNGCTCSSCTLTGCPSGQKLNRNACTCECSRQCPVGQVSSSDGSCSCGCPNSCPSGQISDPSTGCTCRCPNTCLSGQISDPSTGCICRCPNSCPSGQISDPSTGCLCRCPNSCPQGQIPDSINNCVCPRQFQCPPGQTLTKNNLCVPECQNVCPSGQTANPQNGCSCQCPGNCPSGQTADPRKNCACVCPNTCPRGQSPSINDGCRCQCPRSTCQGPTTAQNPATCECECLDPRHTFNGETGTCSGTTNCPQNCPQNSVPTADCSCACPVGTFLNITARTCVPPEVRGQCSGGELSCNSNQVAMRDCNNRCFCACSRGFAGSSCEIRLEPQLCNNCFYDNGHYHSSVLGYCDLFVMCIPTGNKNNTKVRPISFVPFIMSCPPGTFYISRPDGWRGCDHPDNGRCASDRCVGLQAGAAYSDPAACQSFWQCGPDQRLASKGCCPPGQRFDPNSSGCVADSSCPITCGPGLAHGCSGDYNRNINPPCPYDVTSANPNEFFYKVNPGSAFRCPPNTVMDTTSCHCVRNTEPFACDATVSLQFEDRPMNFEDNVPRVPVRDGLAGNFSGSSDIILKAFAGSGFWTDYFQINLRLSLSSSLTRGQRTAVATNADCNLEESVSITVDEQNFYFKILQLSSSQPAEITVPHSGQADQDGWFSVSLLYRRVDPGFEFSGTVDRSTEIYSGSVPLTTYIDVRKCAMHVGQGYRYAGLVGLVDNFEIWRCDPRLSSHGQSG